MNAKQLQSDILEYIMEHYPTHSLIKYNESTTYIVLAHEPSYQVKVEAKLLNSIYVGTELVKCKLVCTVNSVVSTDANFESYVLCLQSARSLAVEVQKQFSTVEVVRSVWGSGNE